jgi:hypothetical protein
VLCTAMLTSRSRLAAAPVGEPVLAHS